MAGTRADRVKSVRDTSIQGLRSFFWLQCKILERKERKKGGKALPKNTYSEKVSIFFKSRALIRSINCDIAGAPPTGPPIEVCGKNDPYAGGAFFKKMAMGGRVCVIY